MIRHYLASALANIARAPFTTAANILTLALGLACFIAAYGIATYWRNADGYHANADRSVVIGQNIRLTGDESNDVLAARSTATLARYLKTDAPAIDMAARAFPSINVGFAAADRKTILDIAYVDPDFLRIFDFRFLAGDARQVLDPGSVILTEPAAERLFPNGGAIGRSVLVNGKWEGTVAGVIAPVRQPSFMGAGPDSILSVDVLAHWTSGPVAASLDSQEIWLSAPGYTFATLARGASINSLNRQLERLLDVRVPQEQKDAGEIRLAAFPVGELTTRELDNLLFAQSGLGATAISALLGLGLLILGVAAMNYANLATAQASTRGKEIGMRRVVGARRFQVLCQSLLETLILTLAALVFSLIALATIAPAVKAWLSVDVAYFLSIGGAPLLVVLAITAAVWLAAGLYPAMALSHMRPADALRSGRSRGGNTLLSRVLVCVQFASASFLLLLLTVMHLQRSHIEDAALANRDHPLIVLNNLSSAGVSFETFRSELLQHAGVESVTIADRIPWTTGYATMQLVRSRDPEADGPQAFLKWVGHDYFETLGLGVLAGRTFERSRETTPTPLFAGSAEPLPVIVDLDYAESLGFETPTAAIDQVVYVPERMTQMWRQPAQAMRIIGVVETDAMRVGASVGAGHMFLYSSVSPFGGGQFPIARLSPDNLQATLGAITNVWDRLAPNLPVQMRFYDDLFEQSYREYARVSQVFTGLAITAFVISSMGLVGIAVHVASRRRHEIAVRKTLGSSVAGVIRLLLTDFSIPVLIGNLLAWPLGYLAAQTYLSAFAHSIDLNLAPFALSLAITLAIAWTAVIGVVLKAAGVRPAEVLRHA